MSGQQRTLSLSNGRSLFASVAKSLKGASVSRDLLQQDVDTRVWERHSVDDQQFPNGRSKHDMLRSPEISEESRAQDAASDFRSGVFVGSSSHPSNVRQNASSALPAVSGRQTSLPLDAAPPSSSTQHGTPPKHRRAHAVDFDGAEQGSAHNSTGHSAGSREGLPSSLSVPPSVPPSMPARPLTPTTRAEDTTYGMATGTDRQGSSRGAPRDQYPAPAILSAPGRSRATPNAPAYPTAPTSSSGRPILDGSSRREEEGEGEGLDGEWDEEDERGYSQAQEREREVQQGNRQRRYVHELVYAEGQRGGSGRTNRLSSASNQAPGLAGSRPLELDRERERVDSRTGGVTGRGGGEQQPRKSEQIAALTAETTNLRKSLLDARQAVTDRDTTIAALREQVAVVAELQAQVTQAQETAKGEAQKRTDAQEALQAMKAQLLMMSSTVESWTSTLESWIGDIQRADMERESLAYATRLREAKRELHKELKRRAAAYDARLSGLESKLRALEAASASELLSHLGATLLAFAWSGAITVLGPLCRLASATGLIACCSWIFSLCGLSTGSGRKRGRCFVVDVCGWLCSLCSRTPSRGGAAADARADDEYEEGMEGEDEGDGYGRYSSLGPVRRRVKGTEDGGQGGGEFDAGPLAARRRRAAAASKGLSATSVHSVGSSRAAPTGLLQHSKSFRMGSGLSRGLTKHGRGLSALTATSSAPVAPSLAQAQPPQPQLALQLPRVASIRVPPVPVPAVLPTRARMAANAAAAVPPFSARAGGGQVGKSATDREQSAPAKQAAGPSLVAVSSFVSSTSSGPASGRATSALAAAASAGRIQRSDSMRTEGEHAALSETEEEGGQSVDEGAGDEEDFPDGSSVEI